MKDRSLVWRVAAALAGGAAVACTGQRGETADATAGRAASAADIQPCRLLTADQVSTVLPGHDDGTVAHAGGSLIAGVDAYQCSYSDSASNLLTVVVNRAVDDARFERIKPVHRGESGVQKVGVADGGWTWGDGDDWRAQVVRGRAVIDVELLAPDAKQKRDQLVGIAGVVAARL